MELLDLSEDQKELLAAILQWAPDVYKIRLDRGVVTPIFARQLRWEQARTFVVYEQLQNAGIILVQGSADVVSAKGVNLGIDAIADLRRREENAAEERERKQRRRERNLLIIGAILASVLGFGFTLLAIYISFRRGWDK